jgi:hypothetical protein
MAVSPNSVVTPQTPKANAVVTTTANTTYTSSPTNTATLATIGANGGRVTRIRSIPRVTITATAMHLFLSTDGGTTKILIDSVTMAADTVSTTDGPLEVDWGYSENNPMILPAAAILYVSQAVTFADGIATAIEWGDY